MPALGARRPSQLLAPMLEICPAGDEKSKIFPALFLQQLPPQLRVLLTKNDLTDLVALAEHTDELWSHQHRMGCWPWWSASRGGHGVSAWWPGVWWPRCGQE
jgi:hypothetical protein